MPSVLFICTANQCRSPIAAATFSEHAGKHPATGLWKISSAGTWTQSGLAVGSRSAELAELVKVDLRQHRTTSVTEVHLSEYDWVIVMERGHREALLAENPKLKGKIKLLTSAAGVPPTDIPDPLLFDTVSAKGILLDMQDCVRLFLDRIAEGRLVE